MPEQQLVLGSARPEPSSPSLAQGGLSFPIRAVFFTVLTLLWFASQSVAANYYVSPSGSDSNSGLVRSPWRTIQHAASTVVAGDTVLVAGGTYNERVTITHSGTVAKPIIFQNLNAVSPVLDGTGLSAPRWSSLLGISSASYVQISGLTVRNYGYYGIEISGTATHITLSNLEVNANSNSGIFIQTTGASPNFITIQQSKVHDNAAGGITVWLSPGGYILIQGNTVYNNYGTGNFDGIQVGSMGGGTHHVVVRANQSHDNGRCNCGADQIDMGGHSLADFYLMEDNDVWGAGGSVKIHNAYGATTLISRRNRMSGGPAYSEYDYPSPAVLYNNTIVNGSKALQIWNDKCISPSPPCSLGGLEFKNNLVIGDTQYTLMIDGPANRVTDMSHSSFRLTNNLYQCTHGIDWNPGIGFTPRIFHCEYPGASGQSEFAAYQATNPPNLQDLGSRLTQVATSSIFVDAANRDFHLVAGSPAIDGGAPLTTTTAPGRNATVIPVVRPDYFVDGWSGLVTPDTIVVGSNPPVSVVATSHANSTITVATPISWKRGDPVTLPYNGSAPDNGAFEFSPGGPQSPVLLNVQPAP